jgi:hypothetical protein
MPQGQFEEVSGIVDGMTWLVVAPVLAGFTVAPESGTEYG